MATVELIGAREVPLGGIRAMTVRRTLPQRRRSLIGAWCFADHYGPDDVGVTGGMDVPPHPHTGLQTVSWLFEGEIEHRDSLGSHAIVRPGELNLMTAGHGIAHSEVSTAATQLLHGVQLWIALPDTARDTDRGFEHHAPTPRVFEWGVARVFLGTLLTDTSPVGTFSPLVGAELVIGTGRRLLLDVDPSFEHGFLVDTGRLLVDGTRVDRAEIGYVGINSTQIELINDAEHPTRLIVLGGAPLEEDLLMWWNFIARTHDEIAQARDLWMHDHLSRFGRVHGYRGPVPHLPAPELPATVLRPRRNPPPVARPESLIR